VSNREPTYLDAKEFIDSGAPAIRAFAAHAVDGETDPIRRMVRLYYAVRDGISYDLYVDYTDPETYRASSVLAAGLGFCVGKAAVFAASARSLGVPARLGFADVRNHLTSPRLYEAIRTDLFTWHGYAEIKLNGVWVKATPAFDKQLCAKVGVDPLEFDGRRDSLFQPFDRTGRRHMEYVNDRGVFDDVPVRQMMRDFWVQYPALMAAPKPRARFADEAVAEVLGEKD